MNIKTYYVLWTYGSNYSKLISIEATTAVDAADQATGHFSKSFQEKGTVYVFDRTPVLHISRKIIL